MRYTSLALDLDGTVLNEVGEIEDHVVSALRCAVEAGVNVYLVSGRMHPAILPFWEKIGLDTPIVSYNGAKIHKPGEAPLYEKKLSAELAAEAFEFCREHDLFVNAYFEDKLYVLRDNDYGRWYSEHFRVKYNILDEKKWPAETPVKLLVIVRDLQELEEVYPVLEERFGGRTAMTSSSDRFAELLPVGVNKAAGLATLAELSGQPLENWVAAGDGMNDLEMLLECGVGLAVENGSKGLLERVPLRVAPLYKGGVEHILGEYFGISVGCV